MPYAERFILLDRDPVQGNRRMEEDVERLAAKHRIKLIWQERATRRCCCGTCPATPPTGRLPASLLKARARPFGRSARSRCLTKACFSGSIRPDSAAPRWSSRG